MRRAKIKITHTRIAVLRCLIDAGRPLSHTDIQKLLDDVDRVTIYRALDTFVAADVAHQVQGIDGAWRFCVHTREGDTCPGGHAHFMCTECGEVVCLTDQMIQRVDVPDGCTIAGKQLVVYGSCERCASKHEDNGDNDR